MYKPVYVGWAYSMKYFW